ncbi:hypothetical protein KIH86_27950 [Paenibacillus sp. HN-1]|uniref:YuiB family protein n=1 Tax=Paenibacillus TaxID=44249 RepID=UPI001CA854F3|nr:MULTISPECIES: YuiB family protein [Paenibacillus]MBY9078811.1 hypothetical protein [Paenibacillus sp. CGMCC 1.18879]MBY9088029.1 hypothetical protein [Paenibacillus sinensis]
MGFISIFGQAVLFLVMMFVIGYILNMLMKTTWFPVYLYVLLILPVMVYSIWDRSSVSLWEHISSYSLVDYLTGIAGLAGVVLSGRMIRRLRLGGYKML